MSKQPIKNYLFQNTKKFSLGVRTEEHDLTKEFPLHWHNFIELEFVTNGNGYQILNGQCQKLSKGSLSILRLTDFHSIVPQDNLQILNLAIDDRILNEDILLKLITNQNLFFTLDENDSWTIEQLLRLCMQEENYESPNREYIKQLVHCLFIKVLKFNQKPNAAQTPENQPLRSAILYMHLHFQENPSLGLTAKIAGYNSSHFSTAFYKTFGMHYCDYLNSLKISYAKELLLSTELKISDICFECGFTSISNFSRLFKLNTGVSPLVYRKNSGL